MGVQSAVKTGVSSLPKPRSIVHQDSQIKCTTAESTAHDFFSIGKNMAGGNPNSVSFYEVMPSNNNGSAPVTNRAFVVSSDSSTAYVDAHRPVWVINKESLASLLEFADSAGCSSVCACVKKDVPMFAEIVRTYQANGFALAPPCNNIGANYVKLAFAI